MKAWAARTRAEKMAAVRELVFDKDLSYRAAASVLGTSAGAISGVVNRMIRGKHYTRNDQVKTYKGTGGRGGNPGMWDESNLTERWSDRKKRKHLSE